jgi:hypothetical protein
MLPERKPGAAAAPQPAWCRRSCTYACFTRGSGIATVRTKHTCHTPLADHLLLLLHPTGGGGGTGTSGQFCWKRTNPVPYQMCDSVGYCHPGTAGEYTTFAACCKSFNSTYNGPLKGDGIKDIRCQLAQGRQEAPCWTPDFQNMGAGIRSCMVTYDSHRCLAGPPEGFATEVSCLTLCCCLGCLVCGF